MCMVFAINREWQVPSLLIQEMTGEGIEWWQLMNVWEKWLTACFCGCITVSLIDHVCILLNPAGETAPPLLFEHISPVPCTERWIPRDDVRGDCCPATQDSSRDGETSSLSQEVKCLFSYHRDDICVIFCLFILVKILQCQDFSIFDILTLPTALYLWHTQAIQAWCTYCEFLIPQLQKSQQSYEMFCKLV